VYPIQTLTRTIRLHRLEDARDRIRTVCAERNYFSPVFQLVRYDFAKGRCPPDPGQVRQDLQTMFETFLALESFTADAVYEDISLKVWELANDEHLHFDWETFQETAGEGVRGLREQGYLIDFGN
jgi:coenzyme F420-reducing hydrogenase gamma subunit